MPTHEEMSRIGKSNVRRSKGHERAVAALLTEWSGVEFRRRRVEGRDSTVIERESTADVIPVSGEIIFSIEAKCGVCPSFDGLLSNPVSNKFTSWWHQATYDAMLLSKTFNMKYYPLLFFKPAKNFNWVAVDKDAFSILKPSATLLAKCPILDANYNLIDLVPSFIYNNYTYVRPIIGNVSHSKKNPVMLGIDLPPLCMMRWKDFAECIDPTSIFR